MTISWHVKPFHVGDCSKSPPKSGAKSEFEDMFERRFPLLSFAYLIKFDHHLIIIWSSFDHHLIKFDHQHHEMFIVWFHDFSCSLLAGGHVEAMSIVLPLRPGPSYRDNFSCVWLWRRSTRVELTGRVFPCRTGSEIRRSGDVSSCRNSMASTRWIEGFLCEDQMDRYADIFRYANRYVVNSRHRSRHL